MEENPLENPETRLMYKRMLASGEFVEAVYHCNTCEHGEIAIVHLSAAREIMCSECHSRDVTRSMLVL